MPITAKRAIAADESEEEQRTGLLYVLIDFLLRPVRPFISRSAWRTYLATALLALTATALFGIAVVSYVFFYYSYVPRIGFERTIHFQFDNVYAAANVAQTAHPYPYGTVILTPDLVGAQAYDIRVELTMPRTPENVEAGNFMLETNMYAADGKTKGAGGGGVENVVDILRPDLSAATLLASSRRPAILPYRSPLVDLLHKATELHWYLLGLRSEAVTLTVPVYERVSFPRARARTPSTLRLEVQSTHRLQIYGAKIFFRARFQGLRWLMYNHRIFAALLFIGTFWLTSVIAAGIAWGALAVYLAQQQTSSAAQTSTGDGIIKKEEEEEEDEDVKPPVLSDTERTYPTLSSQRPLRYSSPPSSDVVVVKREEDEEAVSIPEAVARAAEADDEDEDEDVDFFDSGIGASLESSAGPARSDSIRRRRGRLAGAVKREDKE